MWIPNLDTNRPSSNESSLHSQPFIELEWIIGVLFIFILFRRLDGIVAGTVRKRAGNTQWIAALVANFD